MSKQTKQQAPVYYKMTEPLYGKFATILLTDTAIEFHTTSTFLFILTAWLFACIGFAIGLFTGIYVLIIVLSVSFGILGALLVWKCYVGKLRERYAYNDVTSFVLNGAESVRSTQRTIRCILSACSRNGSKADGKPVYRFGGAYLFYHGEGWKSFSD